MFGTVLSLVLQEEGGGNRQYMELLSDAGKLLTDIHHTETARRELLTFNLKNEVKQTLNEASDVDLLFGSNLGDRFKTSKNLEKSSRDFRSSRQKPSIRTSLPSTIAKGPLNYRRLPHYKQGFRRGGRQPQQTPHYNRRRRREQKHPTYRKNQHLEQHNRAKERTSRK
nr:unnamed protein product [Callosobruchus chinensis]